MAHHQRLFEDQSPLKDKEFNYWEPNWSPVNFMLKDFVTLITTTLCLLCSHYSLVRRICNSNVESTHRCYPS
ncbi:hypothetical protein Q3G72_008559 [Acer saccharum]|nr:hypothetical protein Q3G72_008559 [Acer saccharum]